MESITRTKPLMIQGTSHLDYPQMVLLLFIAPRTPAGPSFFSTITYHPIFNFTWHIFSVLPSYLAQKKPKDFDSFLWPLVEELLQLELGVQAHDMAQSEIFAL
jgi:hypothetical protein